MEERESSSSSDDKTEEASEERRRRFAEEGNIANPREIIHAISLGVFALVAYILLAQFPKEAGLMFSRAWIDLRPANVNEAGLGSMLYRVVQPLIFSISGVLLTVLFLPLVVGLIFTKFSWSSKKLELDLTRMNPVAGLGRMFSFKALPELIKSLAKVIIVGIVAYAVTKDAILDSRQNLSRNIGDITGGLARTVFQLLLATAIAGLVIGVADWAWSWWQLEKQMRMTKDELKKEVKEQEGDPLIKSARRRKAREFVMVRSLQQVSKATFVVTNPEHYAVAIRYRTGMSAPIVVAKGIDFLAARIKEIATKNDVIIVENKPLARALYKTVKIGQEVPTSLYSAIIEVMKYIYQTRGRDYFERLSVLGDRV